VAHFSYLLGFTYWAGMAFTSLILLMVFHAFRAKWMTVIRRPLEIMAVAVAVFLLLFIPLGLGLSHVFSWVNPDPNKFTAHGMHLLHHKHAYLNPGFFWGRTIGYFLVAIFVSQRLFRLSLRQDESGDPILLARQRSNGVGWLPLMSLVLTFASFDWLMSLDPLWFSTIFGVYYFAGSMLGTMALLIIVTVQARGKDLFGNYVSVEHLHNLGKLLFAFTCFWAYIAVSQLLLIWIAGLPEETPFYISRIRHKGWAIFGLGLIFFHFFLMFGLLLSRARKRDPRRLRPVAFLGLFVHLLDVYWLIFPTVDEHTPVFHWTIITAVAGIGGLAIAFAMFCIRGKYTVPVKDPFLPVSLRYRQP